MKRLLSFALTLILITALTPAFAQQASPPNINTASDWAVSRIEKAYAAGIIPDAMTEDYKAPATRIEFCKLALNYLSYTTGKATADFLTERGLTIDPNTFTDTDDPDVLAAAALKIVDGVGDNRFDPDGVFTRQQAATLTRNVCRLIEAYKTENQPEAGFNDKAEIASWAKDAVDFVSAYKIMVGGNHMFMPKAQYTRQQSILTFANILHSPGVFIREDGVTYDPERDLTLNEYGFFIIDSEVALALMLPVIENSHYYFDDDGQLWMDILFPAMPDDWGIRYNALIREYKPGTTEFEERLYRTPFDPNEPGQSTAYNGIPPTIIEQSGRVQIPVDGFTLDSMDSNHLGISLSISLVSPFGYRTEGISIMADSQHDIYGLTVNRTVEWIPYDVESVFDYSHYIIIAD